MQSGAWQRYEVVRECCSGCGLCRLQDKQHSTSRLSQALDPLQYAWVLHALWPIDADRQELQLLASWDAVEVQVALRACWDVPRGLRGCCPGPLLSLLSAGPWPPSLLPPLHTQLFPGFGDTEQAFRFWCLGLQVDPKSQS